MSKEKLNGHDNNFKQCTHFENSLKGGFDLNETCRALLSQTDTGVRDTGPAVRTNWAVSLKRGELHYGVAAVKSGVYGQVCFVCLIFNGEIAATRGALINCFPRTPSPSSRHKSGGNKPTQSLSLRAQSGGFGSVCEINFPFRSAWQNLCGARSSTQGSRLSSSLLRLVGWKKV